ncbi:MAG TPA: FtsX-like permease family protein, partial [Chryseolinea sp.]|nr:FtsX-like permease family protein [Chryseolinea sp.]
DFQVSEFVLDQFNTMAHRDRSDQVRSSTWQAPPKSAIVGSIVMAILILLIACFNLTNTAIAISSRRLKEIGIRKVMGSMRMHLIIQFIGETLFICTCSLLVGIALTDWLILGWNNMVVYIRLTPNYLTDPGFLLFAGGLLLFTALLAGGYPAFYISKFQPVTILKGKLKLAGTNNFTRSLLGLQFTISLITIVSAIGFFQNARYQQGYDLGFNVRGTIVATVGNQSEFETFRNALLNDPNIISMAGTRTGIFSERAHEPVRYESLKLDVDIIDVGENYLQTIGLQLLEGRDFSAHSETDQKESVIITAKMAKALGWQQALGKQIVWRDSVKLFVIGVVKDVYTAGLWRELEPMMIRYVLPQSYSQIVVSTRAEKVSATNAAMNEQWSRIFPNRLYNGRMLVEDLKSVVDVNMTTMYLYAFLGSIAMMLSATGLFTLLSLNIIKRRKEIGVRKILGASVSNIGWILNTEFALILIVASVLGTLASYNMYNAIMSSIWKYYKGVDASTFMLSISLLMAVSLITIGIKVIAIATMNPVTSLRDE